MDKGVRLLPIFIHKGFPHDCVVILTPMLTHP